MSPASYYTSSNSHSDRSYSSFPTDSISYSTSSSTHRATPSYPSNNNHAFLALYHQNGNLVPISPMSHTPQGILPVPAQPDPNKRHRCPECGKGFDRPSALDTHMVTHTKNPLFPCPECDKMFGVKSNRSRHMREKHGISDTDNSNSTRRSNSRYPSSTPSESSGQGSYYSSR